MPVTLPHCVFHCLDFSVIQNVPQIRRMCTYSYFQIFLKIIHCISLSFMKISIFSDSPDVLLVSIVLCVSVFYFESSKGCSIITFITEYFHFYL